MSELVIDPRYDGPPGSGNGGWACGLIAAALPAAARVPEVTLRRPPPLGTVLTVEQGPDVLAVFDPARRIVATATSRADDIPPVSPPAPSELSAAAAPVHGTHHYPSCYVCGPQRPDGLRIAPVRLAGGRTAAVFAPPAATGADLAVTVWAALDCPGGWTVIEPGPPWVLGRLAVAVDRLPGTGEPCLLAGQALRRQGRKALVRTTLYGADRAVLARSEATWIALTG